VVLAVTSARLTDDDCYHCWSACWRNLDVPVELRRVVL